MSQKLLRRHDHPELAKKPTLATIRTFVPAGYSDIAKALRAARTRGHGMTAAEVERLVQVLGQQP